MTDRTVIAKKLDKKLDRDMGAFLLPWIDKPGH